MIRDFLPISRMDMEKRGWDSVDFVFVTGDAYVDHPSFGVAIVTRLLETHGFKVGVVAQPRWKTTEDIEVFGRPRLGFLVSSGNIDSMVNHYTVAKKRRKKDSYTPGGQIGKRPDRSVIVYSNLIRQVYKDVPIIIGGIEASLRRLAHYDYWSNKVRRSVLLDSGADLLVYGMGEHAIVEISEALDSGIPVNEITYITGTVYKTNSMEDVYDAVVLPSFKTITSSKKSYAESFMKQYINTDPFNGRRLVESYNDHTFIVQNPPAKPLTESEMDAVYSLYYERTYHPIYEELGGVPAIQEVKFSLVCNRGCFGDCSFCALTFHQGRIVQRRSQQSLVNEAKQLIWDKDFKGYIHDVGGPTANFRLPSCQKQLKCGVCKHRQCLFPTPCKHLQIDHMGYLNILRALRELPNVKKVFIRSGLRYDYLLYDKNDTFFRELCEHHVSGQLKVAPEHVSKQVLAKMGKPGRNIYDQFVKKYYAINESLGKKQYIVPYLMSSHPGSDMNSAIELAEYLRDTHCTPEQVQDFYPTPSTLSTCMYYTGLDPRTMEEVYVPKSPHEKAMQRALIQYKNPKNYKLVYEALKKSGRDDLIGFSSNCLIRPPRSKTSDYQPYKKSEKKKVNKKKKTIRNVHKKKKLIRGK